jgi:hypothetical protein
MHVQAFAQCDVPESWWLALLDVVTAIGIICLSLTWIFCRIRTLDKKKESKEGEKPLIDVFFCTLEEW